MSVLYAGWGPSPALQTQDWTAGMYYNPASPAGGSCFRWIDDPTFGRSLAITMNDGWAGDASNGKVFVGPSFSAVPSEFFLRLKLKFPSGMPLVTGGWYQFAELYGLPFGNSPTIGLGFTSYWRKTANQWVLSTDSANAYSTKWKGPDLVYDVPHTLDIHAVMSPDPKVGLVELWLDGQRQTFMDGTQTARYATITDTNAKGPQRLIIDQYVGKGVLSQDYTIVHGSPVFGTALTDVQPVAAPVYVVTSGPYTAKFTTVAAALTSAQGNLQRGRNVTITIA